MTLLVDNRWMEADDKGRWECLAPHTYSLSDETGGSLQQLRKANPATVGPLQQLRLVPAIMMFYMGRVHPQWGSLLPYFVIFVHPQFHVEFSRCLLVALTCSFLLGWPFFTALLGDSAAGTPTKSYNTRVISSIRQMRPSFYENAIKIERYVYRLALRLICLLPLCSVTP